MQEIKRKTGNDNHHKQAYRLVLAVLTLIFCISAGVLYHDLVAVPEQNRQMTEQLKEEFPGEALPREPSPHRGTGWRKKPPAAGGSCGPAGTVPGR